MLRAATHNDIPAIAELLLALKRRSDYKTIPHNADRAKATLRRCISSPQGYAHVVERQGRLVAFLIGVVDTHWWSNRRYAADLAYFSRSPRAAEELLAHFTRWAFRSHGVTEVLLAQSSGIKVQQTEQFFKQQGFERVGGVYRRTIYEAMEVAI